MGKRSNVIITSTIFIIVLCGCSENYKQYKEAKEKMNQGTRDASYAMGQYYRDSTKSYPQFRMPLGELLYTHYLTKNMKDEN